MKFTKQITGSVPVILLAFLLTITSCSKDSKTSKNPAQDPIIDNFLPEISKRDMSAPFGKKRFITFDKVVEYLVLGSNYGGLNKTQVLVDPYQYYGQITDKKIVPAPVGTEILDSQVNEDILTTMKKVAKAGNFDDDTSDEVAMVSWNSAGGKGKLTIIDTENSIMTNSFPAVDLGIKTGDSDTKPDYDIAVADTDKDGYDEIVIVGTLVNETRSSGQMWILDDAIHSYAIIKKVELKGNSDVTYGARGVQKARVVAGNGSNNKVKIAVGWTDCFSEAPSTSDANIIKISYTVYNGEDANPVRTASTGMLINYCSTDYPLFSMALADINKDKKKELIFMGVSDWWNTEASISGYVVNRVEIIGDFDNTGTVLKQYSNTSWSGAKGTLTPFQFNHLVPVDYDLDRKDELLIGQELFKFNNGQLDKQDSFLKGWDWKYINDVQVGDINCDMKPDLIFLITNDRIITYCYLDRDDASGPPRWTQFINGTESTSVLTNSILVPMHSDNDTVFMEYNGDNTDLPAVDIEEAHTVIYSDVKIIALLAAPPTKDEIGQNGGETSLGKGTETSYSKGADLSVRAGLMVGTDFEVSPWGIKAVEVEAEITTQVEANCSEASGTTTSVTITDTTPAGEDLVIFTAVPYDVFTYTFASHPNKEFVGKKFAVRIPQPIKIVSTSLDYFNATTTGMKISKGLLQHTPYDLSTYPKTADVEIIYGKTSIDVGDGNTLATEITPFGQKLGPFLVNQGNGSKSAEVSISNDYTSSHSLTLSVDASAKVTAGAVSGGVSAGVSYGQFFEYSISNNTTFSGTVGAIPGDYYAGNQYSWGIFAYNQVLKDDKGKKMQDFMVVNYWVE